MVYKIINKEKELPIVISHYAMKRLFEETGKNISDVLFENNGFNADLEKFLYYCLESGFRAEKRVFDMKMEDMEWVLDDNFMLFQNLIQDNFERLGKEQGNKKKVTKP